MKRSASVFYLAFAFTLVLGVGPAWTFECPSLYAKCQELLKIKKNEEAKKLCEQGIKLHKAGEHDDAVEKLEAGLDLLKKK